jgi:hypothetical protein
MKPRKRKSILIKKDINSLLWIIINKIFHE